MNHTSRSVGTAIRKRKDREDSSFYNHKGSFVNKYQQHHHHQPHNNAIPNSRMMMMLSSEPGHGIHKGNPGPSNQVLAGFMAHEFLTKGTLFGQKFDPARAEAMPVSAAEPKRRPFGGEPEVVLKKPNQSYAEVAQLLKGVDGAHIPGIVNPTQLARWIQM